MKTRNGERLCAVNAAIFCNRFDYDERVVNAEITWLDANGLTVLRGSKPSKAVFSPSFVSQPRRPDGDKIRDSATN